jgi:hypothetical protein
VVVVLLLLLLALPASSHDAIAINDPHAHGGIKINLDFIFLIRHYIYTRLLEAKKKIMSIKIQLR